MLVLKDVLDLIQQDDRILILQHGIQTGCDSTFSKAERDIFKWPISASFVFIFVFSTLQNSNIN